MESIKNKKQTIVFYNDSRIVGGHEILAIEAAKSLVGLYNIVFICSKENFDLHKRLNEISAIQVIPIEYSSNRLQFIRNFTSNKTKIAILKILKDVGCDLCILVQGNIESSYIAAKSARKCKIPCISYIPLTQPFRRTSKNKFVGFFKDLLRPYFYSIPNAFITITDSLKYEIKKVAPEKRVFVVYNKIQIPQINSINKTMARDYLSLPKDKYIVGYIGRMEAWHKGLDMYVEYLSKHASVFKEILFIFVGKGSYQNNIERLCHEKENVKYIHWINDTKYIYSSIDCLILPSRYEGMSLSMLEGMAFGIPLITSDIPEFKEYIPTSNRFQFANFDALTACLRKALNRRLEIINIPEIISKPNHFEKEFRKVIETYLKPI